MVCVATPGSTISVRLRRSSSRTLSNRLMQSTTEPTEGILPAREAGTAAAWDDGRARLVGPAEEARDLIRGGSEDDGGRRWEMAAVPVEGIGDDVLRLGENAICWRMAASCPTIFGKIQHGKGD